MIRYATFAELELVGVRRGHQAMKLLERGCDPNAQEGGFKKTPLDGVIPYGAVNQTHLEMVKLLLDHGANPKLMVDGLDRLSGGRGGSDGAIRAEIARLLKEHGADMTKMMSDLK